MKRRGFFTAIGAAVAAVSAAEAASAPVEFPENACALCGFDQRLTPYGGRPVYENGLPVAGARPLPRVMRCTDRMGCQNRQLNVLLGGASLWQERTGVRVTRGERR